MGIQILAMYLEIVVKIWKIMNKRIRIPKPPKRTEPKNNQDLENLPNVPVNRSERRGETNTENDTEERDNEEFNPPNKLKSFSKTLNSITTLKIEVKDSKGKDTDINRINDEPDAPDEEHKNINTVLIDDNEH